MKAFYMMFVVFAVLLLGAPMASAQDGWPGCPWGSAYDPTEHGFIAECFWQPAANAAASKPAGLAKPAPVEQFVPCSFGEGIDPLLDPQALACLSQSFPAAKAASKPAGLAAPAPAVIPEQRLSCLSWHDAYDPMTHALVLECLSWSTDKAAAPKTAGLAQLAPVEASAACGVSEQLDPLLDPLALACLTQPFPTARAASKPVGLAAPAPVQEQPFCEHFDPQLLMCLR
jgi:hypothetical protein